MFIDLVYTDDTNYYPQLFLGKKYIFRKKKEIFITDDIEIYSDDSDDSDEKTQMKATKYIICF